MTRSLLRPIRTRRVAVPTSTHKPAEGEYAALTPATRKTLAAIGALWVSFGAGSPLSAAPASLAR